MTKRYINIRPMFILFIGLMAGIAFSYLFICNKISYFVAILIAMLVVFLSIALIIYAKYTATWNSFYPSRKNISSLILISSKFFIVSFIVGVVISSFPLYKISTHREYYEDVSITGVVSDSIIEKETYTAFILSDCIVDNKSQELDIVIYTSAFTDIKLGDKVKLHTTIDSFRVNDNYGLSRLIDGVGYSGYVNYSDIDVIDNDASLKDAIKTETKEILSSRLSDDNADIMYSIIFGESNSIDKGIEKEFSLSGISHILAVSGLHVSVLFGLLYFILKKCKVRKKWSPVILSILLLLYSYLCSFSPSVCRASLMVILAMICEICKKEYDPLSGLSIAGTIILIISPMQFFSVSFRLSFLCVFAIISLAPFLTKLFTKIKCPEKLAGLIAISVSISIVTMPVMLNTFSEVSLLGILSNIIVIPVFTVLYTITIPILLITAIIRPIGVLLFVPNMFLHIIKVVASYIASIPFAVFRAFNISYILLVLIVMICLIVQFLIVSGKVKALISLMLLTTSITYLITESIPASYAEDALAICYSNNSNAVYYLKDSSLSIIGCDVSGSELDSRLRELKIRDVSSIVAYDFDWSGLNDLILLCDDYDIETVYLSIDFSNINLGESVEVVFYEESFLLGNIRFNKIDYYEDLSAIELDFNNKSIVLAKEINTTEEIYLKNEYAGSDYLIIDKISSGNMEEGFDTIICNKTEKTDTKNVLNLKLYDKIMIR